MLMIHIFIFTVFRKTTPQVVYFIGIGEDIDDLMDFEAQNFASSLLGL